MIEVNSLRFEYPGSESHFALRGVSFTLKLGEKVALMGTNGSGKTTFVHCLNGLLKPISGEVVVDGLSTKESKELYEIRRRVGMVFQNPDNQIVATTVEREIAFGMENLGIVTEEMHERVEEVLDLFHLKAYRNTPPHMLSGGERQRLALASVWVMRPSYLILDEPTSLLDPRGRIEVLRLLQWNIERSGMGILLVTQYPEEALGFDRLVVMDRGKIVFDGPPRIVFQNVEELHRMGLDVPVEVELDSFFVQLS
jgi:energy-coupling factor transport system ATP-binding protein